MLLQEGKELQQGKYKIIRVLGQGGFGITYLALHTMLDKYVAIKEFFPADFCERDYMYNLTIGTQSNVLLISKLKERFLKEARNTARLNHPSIIKIYDVFEENNTAYYVMEYLEGENLNDIVQQHGPFAESRAIEFIAKVGEALEHVHSRNMTHFDVKPANIIIKYEDSSPVLIDFGLSKQFDSHGDATSVLIPGISYGYSPIEMYSIGDNVTFSPQVDIYSLAATLYYLLEGQAPPQATDLIHTQIQFPYPVRNRIANEILKGMSLDKNHRHKNIQQFVTELVRLNNDGKTAVVKQDVTELVERYEEPVDRVASKPTKVYYDSEIDELTQQDSTVKETQNNQNLIKVFEWLRQFYYYFALYFRYFF